MKRGDPLYCREVLIDQKTYFGIVLDVFPSGPDQDHQVHKEDAAYGRHDHGIVHKCGKQFHGLADIDGVGHDEERTPEKCQMVTETLGAGGDCFGANLQAEEQPL